MQRITLLVWIVLLWVMAPAAHTQSLVLEGKNGWLFAGWESLSDDNKAGIDQTARLIGEVHKELKVANVRLYVLVVPMKALTYPENLPSAATVSESINKRYGYILSALSHEQIQTIDLRPVIDAIKKHHLAFYRTDYHWTPWSAEAAANAVAEMMGHSAAAIGAGSETWRQEKRFGDLANLLSRERRKEIGEEQFSVRVKIASGNLLDDAKPKLQVIGNSFVQPYLGFPEALSARLGLEVGLSWNYGNVGPWVTLLKYLQSDSFKTARPQSIIWQWNEAQFANGPDAVGQWAKESIIAPSEWLNQLKSAVSR